MCIWAEYQHPRHQGFLGVDITRVRLLPFIHSVVVVRCVAFAALAGFFSFLFIFFFNTEIKLERCLWIYRMPPEERLHEYVDCMHWRLASERGRRVRLDAKRVAMATIGNYSTTDAFYSCKFRNTTLDRIKKIIKQVAALICHVEKSRVVDGGGVRWDGVGAHGPPQVSLFWVAPANIWHCLKVLLSEHFNRALFPPDSAVALAAAAPPETASTRLRLPPIDPAPLPPAQTA